MSRVSEDDVPWAALGLREEAAVFESASQNTWRHRGVGRGLAVLFELRGAAHPASPPTGRWPTSSAVRAPRRTS